MSAEDVLEQQERRTERGNYGPVFLAVGFEFSFAEDPVNPGLVLPQVCYTHPANSNQRAFILGVVLRDGVNTGLLEGLGGLQIGWNDDNVVDDVTQEINIGFFWDLETAGKRFAPFGSPWPYAEGGVVNTPQLPKFGLPGETLKIGWTATPEPTATILVDVLGYLI